MLRPEEVLGEMEVEQGEAAKKWNSSQCSQPVDHLLTGGFSFICGPRPSVSGYAVPFCEQTEQALCRRKQRVRATVLSCLLLPWGLTSLCAMGLSCLILRIK